MRKKLAEARILGIQRVLANKPPKISNRYCAWVSSSRRATERGLFSIFDEVECSSGGRTKFNRETLQLPKDHHYDALCVGTVPEGGFMDLNFKAKKRVGNPFDIKVSYSSFLVRVILQRAHSLCKWQLTEDPHIFLCFVLTNYPLGCTIIPVNVSLCATLVQGACAMFLYQFAGYYCILF